jgi:hypothetical protein
MMKYFSRARMRSFGSSAGDGLDEIGAQSARRDAGSDNHVVFDSRIVEICLIYRSLNDIRRARFMSKYGLHTPHIEKL